MVNAAQVLTIYQEAVKRVTNKTATPEDHLIVVMWDDNQQMQAEINAMSYKISVLETREAKQVSEFDRQQLLTEAAKEIKRIQYMH